MLPRMYVPVPTKDPTAVEVEVQAAYLGMFPRGERLFVPRVFKWAIECFTGKYGDYQAIDARYHDFEHTLQGTLCLGRLLRARQAAGAQPLLTPHSFELALVACLLHDTGYLKRRNDTEGTGAKYTVTHVSRSAQFAAQLLAEKKYAPEDIEAVRHIILCTGVSAELSAIRFQSELEKVCGCALATADLLGQMAAEDYLEKLPVLYAEFAEAVCFSGSHDHFIARFSSARDLIERTPGFWNEFILPKLEGDLMGLYRFLNEPFPDGPNYYLARIAENMERLQRGLERHVA